MYCHVDTGRHSPIALYLINVGSNYFLSLFFYLSLCACGYYGLMLVLFNCSYMSCVFIVIISVSTCHVTQSYGHLSFMLSTCPHCTLCANEEPHPPSAVDPIHALVAVRQSHEAPPPRTDETFMNSHCV